MLTFRALGPWEAVECRWAASTLRPDAAALARIESAWAQARRRPGVQLFDGPMCRLESFVAEGNRLSLVLSPTSYKLFLGTNMANPSLAERANPVGMSCALVSSEGTLLMGRRNERVAYYPGRVHPFAGSLEPADGADVFNAVRRELAEELAIKAEDLIALSCLGMVEDHALRQPELVCLARTRLPAAQIERQVDRGEHVACCAIAPEAPAAERMLRSGATITPVGVGTILLWGRWAFGDEWFEGQRAIAVR